MCVLRYYRGVIRQTYLNGVTAPFGCTSGWVALGSLEYLTPVPCSDIAFLCFPCCTHHLPVFQSIFHYVPVPKWLCSQTCIYRPPPCTVFNMFEYRLWLLFSLSTQPLVTSDIHPTHVIWLLVTSECTALLSWRSDFGGVSDSGFSSCTAPTY